MTYLEPIAPGQAATLREVTFEIVDLPGDLLGLAHGQNVQIDVAAAGHGWFVDLTPWSDEEFYDAPGHDGLPAIPAGPADRRADLLTVVLHELGHILGQGHQDQGLMDDSLPLGTRRLPTWASADGPGLSLEILDAALVDQAFAT